jgi:hypothetical protein
VSVNDLGQPHIHVTEREIAHVWPNGKPDDAKWEDCTYCAALEWARALGVDAPASHGEAELLRAEVDTPLGGSTIEEAATALTKRYGVDAPIVKGWTALRAKLVPGAIAVCQGNMGLFPKAGHWRRWDPAFGGIHATFIEVRDPGPTVSRVWWCDPLAPAGTSGYAGEWMSLTDLQKYVTGFTGGGHIVGTRGGAVAIATVTQVPFATPRHFAVAAGATVRGYRPDSSKPVKSQTFSSASGAHASASAIISQAPDPHTVPHGAFLLASDGMFAGLYIPVSQVTLDPPPAAPVVDCGVAVAQAVAPLNLKITELTQRLNGVKAKVAANAADVADD